MNYQETMKYMLEQLPMFQREGGAAYKADLHVTKAMDKYFGHPHRQFKSIHIAGTNGKGSTAHFVASILQEAGYKTGLYTSPHLLDYRERIKINGKCIDKKYISDFISNHQQLFNKLKPSFFELSVALAFEYFCDEKVDFGIIETGLGGRLDSTNIIAPEISVITNIGLDHTEFLGDTIEKIAIEKAGIIKKNIPVIINETQSATKPVFESHANEKTALLYFADEEYYSEYSMVSIDGEYQVLQIKNKRHPAKEYPNLHLPLKGEYQRKNLQGVLKCVDLLQEMNVSISKKHVYDGIKHVIRNTGMKGRWQLTGTNPTVICDTAHNEDGLTQVIKQLINMPKRQLHIIFGIVKDKKTDTILKILPGYAYYYFTKANIPRAMHEKELYRTSQKYQLKGHYFGDVIKAFEAAKANADKQDIIFIGGSTFLVADFLKYTGKL
jgi:dihydrofolate synthase / folylpolyglutamate synthase